MFIAGAETAEGTTSSIFLAISCVGVGDEVTLRGPSTPFEVGLTTGVGVGLTLLGSLIIFSGVR